MPILRGESPAESPSTQVEIIGRCDRAKENEGEEGSKRVHSFHGEDK